MVLKNQHISLQRFNNGVLRPSDMHAAKGKLTYAVLSIIMICYLVVVFVPVIWMVLLCFKSPAEIYSKTPSFFPQTMDIKKLAELWNHFEIYKYYLNTTIMGLGCVASNIIIDGFAGYAISRLKPRGYRGYFMLVSMMMLMPATCAMIPNYMLYKSLGLLNTYFPIWLMAGVNMFSILLYKSAFDGVSMSLIEAAHIDGADSVTIFIKVVVPISVPVIATNSIFIFNQSFGDFFWPYLLITNPDKMVMGVKLFMIKNSTMSMDEQMMTALFAILPQIVIFVAFQRYIMGGISLGGVKE